MLNNPIALEIKQLPFKLVTVAFGLLDG